jgi:hypothetical protein
MGMLTYVRTCQTHQSLLFYGLRSFCLNERVTTCDQRQWLVSSKTSFLYDISAGVSSLRCPQLRYGNWCLGRDQMEWDLPKLAEGFNMFQPFSACHCFGKMIHDDPSRLVYTCVTSVLRIQIFGTQDPQSLELEGSCCIILWKSTAYSSQLDWWSTPVLLSMSMSPSFVGQVCSTRKPWDHCGHTWAFACRHGSWFSALRQQ